jgi:thioredoxin-like negative regulator of GroEL
MIRRLLALSGLLFWLCATGLAAPPEPTPVLPAPATARQPEPTPIGEDIPDWEARWELARLLSYTKRYDEALLQYQKVLQARPDLQKARIEMAQVYSWAGQSDRALEQLGQVGQDQLDQESRLALADIFIAAKQYLAAEALLSEHLEQHPADDQVRLKLAELLSWTKRYGESLDQYAQILAHRPDDVQVRRKYAYVLIWSGRREEAMVELRRSLGE